MKSGIALLFCGLIAATSPAQAEPADQPGEFMTAIQNAPAAAEAYISQAGELVMHAMGLLGIRYRWGGDQPETGFDCSGLVRHVFQQAVGLLLPRDSYGMARLGTQVAADQLQPGDLVFFNTQRRPYSHVGIYLGERRFVHAPSRGGRVEIVDMGAQYWRQRFNGARRIDL